MALIQINTRPSLRELRWFTGLIFPLFFALVGGLAFHLTGSLGAAGAIFAPAAAVGVAGLVFPKFAGLVYVAWIHAVYPLGWTMSHAVLAVVFFLAITPIGWILRLARHDPLTRKFDRQAGSYWIQRPTRARPSRYFQQF